LGALSGDVREEGRALVDQDAGALLSAHRAADGEGRARRWQGRHGASARDAAGGVQLDRACAGAGSGRGSRHKREDEMKRLFAAAVLAAALFGPSAVQAQSAPAVAAAIPRIVMVKLNVTDFARSERFYREVFGLGAPRVFNDHEHGFSFPNAAGAVDP